MFLECSPDVFNHLGARVLDLASFFWRERWFSSQLKYPVVLASDLFGLSISGQLTGFLFGKQLGSFRSRNHLCAHLEFISEFITIGNLIV